MGIMKRFINPDTVSVIGLDRTVTVKKFSRLPDKIFHYKDRDYSIIPDGIWLGRNGTRHVIFMEDVFLPITPQLSQIDRDSLISSSMTILDHDNTIRELSPTTAVPPTVVFLAVGFALMLGIVIGISIAKKLIGVG